MSWLQAFCPDISFFHSIFSLKEIAISILKEHFRPFDTLSKRFADDFSSSQQIQDSVIGSLKQFTLQETTPQMQEYYSRMVLRSLAGLSPVFPAELRKDAIKTLEGSISWITEVKIDVTGLIREMRETE